MKYKYLKSILIAIAGLAIIAGCAFAMPWNNLGTGFAQPELSVLNNRIATVPEPFIMFLCGIVLIGSTGVAKKITKP